MQHFREEGGGGGGGDSEMGFPAYSEANSDSFDIIPHFFHLGGFTKPPKSAPGSKEPHTLTVEPVSEA